MITNERQYKITRSEADRFRNAISDLAKGPARQTFIRAYSRLSARRWKASWPISRPSLPSMTG